MSGLVSFFSLLLSAKFLSCGAWVAIGWTGKSGGQRAFFSPSQPTGPFFFLLLTFALPCSKPSLCMSGPGVYRKRAISRRRRAEKHKMEEFTIHSSSGSNSATARPVARVCAECDTIIGMPLQVHSFFASFFFPSIFVFVRLGATLGSRRGFMEVAYASRRTHVMSRQPAPPSSVAGARGRGPPARFSSPWSCCSCLSVAMSHRLSQSRRGSLHRPAIAENIWRAVCILCQCRLFCNEATYDN